MGSLGENELHYNDWPNAQGFDVRYEEKAPVELAVVGTIPAYAAGTLFRTGVGPRTIDTDSGSTFRVNHWFDSLAQVHRFQIHPPTAEHPHVRVSYNSRLTCDGVVERIQKTGHKEEYSFGAKYDLCTSYFQKLQSFFAPAPRVNRPDQVSQSITLSVNFPGLTPQGRRSDAGVGERKQIHSLCNKTDSNSLQMLDPQTLEPIGLARQSTLHPLLTGPSSATHAKSDPRTGDVFNYNLDYGRTGIYRVFTVSASSGKTSILATISAPGSYIHSLFLTDHYVILCVWNAFFSWAGTSLFYHKNVVDAIAPYDDRQPATWFVVDRIPSEAGGKGLIATYESSPFFAFHAINAYEEGGRSGDSDEPGWDIIADVAAYDTNAVVKHFFLDNLMSNSPTARTFRDERYADCRSSIRRFKLPAVPTDPTPQPLAAELVFSKAPELSMELPTINQSKIQQRYRYIYGVTETGQSSFFDGLVKYDLETHQHLAWNRHGQTAGEPIFVANPDAVDEDDGVVLSVVLDGTRGKSYLLVLDAKKMQEVGRANVDGPVGFGFHGTFMREAGVDGAFQY